jgi:hypothetical protein
MLNLAAIPVNNYKIRAGEKRFIAPNKALKLELALNKLIQLSNPKSFHFFVN